MVRGDVLRGNHCEFVAAWTVFVGVVSQGEAKDTDSVLWAICRHCSMAMSFGSCNLKMVKQKADQLSFCGFPVWACLF